MRKTLMLAALLTGCGGVEATALGGGRYAINAEGRNRGELMTESYQQAEKICPDGYDVIDVDRDTRQTPVSFDGGKTTTIVRKSTATLIIQCKRGGDDDE